MPCSAMVSMTLRRSPTCARTDATTTLLTWFLCPARAGGADSLNLPYTGIEPYEVPIRSFQHPETGAHEEHGNAAGPCFEAPFWQRFRGVPVA